MEMSQGEMKMEHPKAPEAPNEKVIVLDRAGLMARHAEIAALTCDELDVSKSLDKQGLLNDRKAALNQIGEILRDMHPSKLVLVTEIDGKISGCMVVDKGEHATVEHLWTQAGGDSKTQILGSLVNAALAGLKHGPHSFEKLHIHADPASRSNELQRYIASFPENSSKLVIGGIVANDTDSTGTSSPEKAA